MSLVVKKSHFFAFFATFQDFLKLVFLCEILFARNQSRLVVCETWFYLFSHRVQSSFDLRENSDSVGGIFSYLMCAKFDRSCPANVFVDGNAGLRLGWSWTERRLRRTPTGGRGATEDC